MKRSRINPVSKSSTAKTRTAQIRIAYAIVAERSRGRCEGCARSGLPLQFAHLFGRSHLGRWSHEPAFTAMLCLPCHTSIDGYTDESKRRVLEERACQRFAEEYGLEGLLDDIVDDYTPRHCAKILTGVSDKLRSDIP